MSHESVSNTPDSENQPKIEFTSNPLLHAMVLGVSTIPFDAHHAINRLMSNPETHSITSPRHRMGLMLEAHLDNVLEYMANEETYGKYIQLNPIKDETTVGQYKFMVDQFLRLKATRLTIDEGIPDYKGIADYDELTLLTYPNHPPLPVVWEAKVFTTKNRERLYRKLREDSISNQFAPLVEAFNTTSFGMVVVTLQGGIRRNSENMKKFRDNGVIFVEVPITVDEFLKQVLPSEETQF